MKAYDFHGTVTSGLKPEKGSVIITGSTKDFENEIRAVVGNDMPIYFAADGTSGYREKAMHKAKIINDLGIEEYYEDEKRQAEILRSETKAKIILVSEMKKDSKKKVTVITDEWLAPSLSLALKNEGCDVMLAAKRPTNILKGTIQRVPYARRKEEAALSSLVIYEDKSNRGESHEMRLDGSCVIGGDRITDRLELDRTWANNIARMSGLHAPEMFQVESFEEVRNIIAERGGKWVLKQQGKLDEIKGLNFVAKMPNSEDLLDFLPVLESKWVEGVKKDFVLQEKVEGHEMACGSFWNGHEFMKDQDGDELCYENWEHKSLFPGNLGESTGEQYTVIRCVKAKTSKLFMETLDKCRELLKRANYRGYFDVNNIVTEKGAYFLEFTPRMGVPFTSGLLEIHKSSWFDFLYAIADGEQDRNFEYDPRFCVVSWLYTKPFPFVTSHKLTAIYEEQQTPTSMEEIAELMSFRMANSENILVNFTPDFTKEDWSHIHPDGLRYDGKRLKIANPDGYILTCTGAGKTPEEAGEAVEAIFKKIVIPKMFWRNDFSKSNYHKSEKDLEKWGYLDDSEKKREAEQNERMRQDVRSAIKNAIMQ